MILFLENEDCCFTAEPGAAASPSHLCIPPRKDGHAAAADDDDEDDDEDEEGGDESGPTRLAPASAPCRRSPCAGRRSDLVLLGCGALLAAVGLGRNLLLLAQPEDSVRPRWEGFFHRPGSHKRSTSPPTRRLFRRESPRRACERGLPSSYTLLSLSSVSDCNSTRSLLRADSNERLALCPASPAPPVSQRQACHAPWNPLVNTHLESFKRNPRQSLTPTHVPAAPSCSGGLRRTPSDGAIKRNCPPSHLEPLPEKSALENTGEGSTPALQAFGPSAAVLLMPSYLNQHLSCFTSCFQRWI